MCDPVTASVVLAGVSTGAQAYSSYQQGKYQEAVAEQNAEALEASAADASMRGVAEGEQARNRYKGLIGRQVTSAAASGLDISSGTPLQIFSETAQLGEFDAQMIESNARREAYGLRSGAVGQRQQGRLARSAGRNRAFTTLLTGGARMASMGSALSSSAGGGANSFASQTPGPRIAGGFR